MAAASVELGAAIAFLRRVAGRAALRAPHRAAIHPPVDALTATIELPIACFAAPVEARVDTVAFRIEPLGGERVPGRVGTIRRAIEAPVRLVTTPVEVVLDAITAIVEALLDAVATCVRAIGRIRECLRAAHQES